MKRVYSDRILCTELCPALTSRLLVVKPKQKHVRVTCGLSCLFIFDDVLPQFDLLALFPFPLQLPGEVVQNEFQLPSGIRILRVYLTAKEADDLSATYFAWQQQPGAANCTFQPLVQVKSSEIHLS